MFRTLVLGLCLTLAAWAVYASELHSPEAEARWRCPHKPDGACAPKINTHGWYPTLWRKWPEPPEADQEEVPTPAAAEKTESESKSKAEELPEATKKTDQTEDQDEDLPPQDKSSETAPDVTPELQTPTGAPEESKSPSTTEEPMGTEPAPMTEAAPGTEPLPGTGATPAPTIESAPATEPFPATEPATTPGSPDEDAPPPLPSTATPPSTLDSDSKALEGDPFEDEQIPDGTPPEKNDKAALKSQPPGSSQLRWGTETRTEQAGPRLTVFADSDEPQLLEPSATDASRSMRPFESERSNPLRRSSASNRRTSASANIRASYTVDTPEIANSGATWRKNPLRAGR